VHEARSPVGVLAIRLLRALAARCATYALVRPVWGPRVVVPAALAQLEEAREEAGEVAAVPNVAGARREAPHPSVEVEQEVAPVTGRGMRRWLAGNAPVAVDSVCWAAGGLQSVFERAPLPRFRRRWSTQGRAR
jgi:hypothetical protein